MDRGSACGMEGGLWYDMLVICVQVATCSEKWLDLTT
jgi:hypothetical protein